MQYQGESTKSKIHKTLYNIHILHTRCICTKDLLCLCVKLNAYIENFKTSFPNKRDTLYATVCQNMTAIFFSHEITLGVIRTTKVSYVKCYAKYMTLYDSKETKSLYFCIKCKNKKPSNIMIAPLKYVQLVS